MSACPQRSHRGRQRLGTKPVCSCGGEPGGSSQPPGLGASRPVRPGRAECGIRGREAGWGRAAISPPSPSHRRPGPPDEAAVARVTGRRRPRPPGSARPTPPPARPPANRRGGGGGETFPLFSHFRGRSGLGRGAAEGEDGLLPRHSPAAGLWDGVGKCPDCEGRVGTSHTRQPRPARLRRAGPGRIGSDRIGSRCRGAPPVSGAFAPPLGGKVWGRGRGVSLLLPPSLWALPPCANGWMGGWMDGWREGGREGGTDGRVAAAA